MLVKLPGGWVAPSSVVSIHVEPSFPAVCDYPAVRDYVRVETKEGRSLLGYYDSPEAAQKWADEFAEIVNTATKDGGAVDEEPYVEKRLRSDCPA